VLDFGLVMGFMGQVFVILRLDMRVCWCFCGAYGCKWLDRWVLCG
jgi:hypothetical protein